MNILQQYINENRHLTQCSDHYKWRYDVNRNVDIVFLVKILISEICVII